MVKETNETNKSNVQEMPSQLDTKNREYSNVSEVQNSILEQRKKKRKQYQKEYQQRWYQLNRERLKQKARQYHHQNKEYCNNRSKKYYYNHIEKIKQREKERWLKNRSELIPLRKEYYKQNKKNRMLARSYLNKRIERKMIPKAKSLKCVNCNNQAKEYHHYLGYLKANWEDIIPLCKRCHIIKDKEFIDNELKKLR